jgi:hypothetical protein
MKAIATLTFVSLLALGCGPAMNAESGEDQKRAGALSAPPSTLHHDRVDRSAGDATDWKTFTVSAEGTAVKLAIWWDSPDVDATVSLVDVFGATHHTLQHQRGVRQEGWAAVPVSAGTWFLRVEASGGASVYTLEWSLVSSAPGGAPPRPF